MEDVELVRRMMAGDGEAFGELMIRTQRDLMRLSYLISGNYADSEDIVQETYVQAFLKRGTIKSPEFFKTWLIRTMTRTAWRYLKKKGREMPSGDATEDQAAALFGSLEDAAALQAERDDENRRLYEAIFRLPVKHRTAVILYYFEEMTTKEIAAASGCLEGTVKSRLYTARRRLKEELDGKEMTAERRLSL